MRKPHGLLALAFVLFATGVRADDKGGITAELASIRVAVAALRDQVAALQAANASLQVQVSHLQTSNVALQAQISALQATDEALKASIDAEQNARIEADVTLQRSIAGLSVPQNLLDLAKFVSVDQSEVNSVPGPNVIFTGVNVHVRNGLGSTSGGSNEFDARPNGLGNLIIGYNESCGFCSSQPPRTGSHNVVLGVANGYSSIGGLVSGFVNVVRGAYSSAIAGQFNTVNGVISAVLGGASNIADGASTSITGGEQNQVSSFASSVSGGLRNVASGQDSWVSGGNGNVANGEGASVSGGLANTASGQDAAVSGGRMVTATDPFSWAAGTLRQP